MVSGDSLDPAGLYRTLKRMGSVGLVCSLKSCFTENGGHKRANATQ